MDLLSLIDSKDPILTNSDKLILLSDCVIESLTDAIKYLKQDYIPIRIKKICDNSILLLHLLDTDFVKDPQSLNSDETEKHLMTLQDVFSFSGNSTSLKVMQLRNTLHKLLNNADTRIFNLLNESKTSISDALSIAFKQASICMYEIHLERIEASGLLTFEQFWDILLQHHFSDYHDIIVYTKISHLPVLLF